MQFAAATLALFISLAASVAVPAAEPVGMVQRLHPRSASGEMIFGRSFACSANNPTTCCAVSSGHLQWLSCRLSQITTFPTGNLSTRNVADPQTISAVAATEPASMALAAATEVTARYVWDRSTGCPRGPNRSWEKVLGRAQEKGDDEMYP